MDNIEILSDVEYKISGDFDGFTDNNIRVIGTYTGILLNGVVRGTIKGITENNIQVGGYFTSAYDGSSSLDGLMVVSSDSGVGITTEPQSDLNNSSVIDIISVDPGFGYLRKPNGTAGGNGIVFAKNSNIIVYDVEQKYYIYSEGDVVSVSPGYTVCAPLKMQISIFDENRNPVINIMGKGFNNKIPIKFNGSFTVPKYEEDTINDDKVLPISSDGSYPVILAIKYIEILNPGINYKENDEIAITPSYGAILKPHFSKNGQLTKVDVINGGIGFDVMPKLSIKSTTGVNAVMQPVFTIIRINEIPNGLNAIPPGTNILSVVQCIQK